MQRIPHRLPAAYFQSEQLGLQAKQPVLNATLNKGPQFSRMDAFQVAHLIDNQLKGSFFSKDRNYMGASLPDLISRSNMAVGKYLPEQVIAFATGIRPWETLARNVLTWVSSAAVTVLVKDDSIFSINSLLFDHFMRKQEKMAPLPAGASFNQKIRHGWRKWLNSLGMKDHDYFKVLEASGFIHRVPYEKKDRAFKKSYWRNIMDANLVEHLKTFQTKLPKEAVEVEAIGKELQQVAQQFAQEPKVGEVLTKDILTKNGIHLADMGDRVANISREIQDHLTELLKTNTAKSEPIQWVEKLLHRLQKIKSRDLTHIERRQYAPFITTMIKRINVFSILSTAAMTLINTGAGILSFWLTFRFFAQYDKAFDKEKYKLATQKKKREHHLEALLTQKPIERLPARLVKNPSYNYKDFQSAELLENGKLVHHNQPHRLKGRA